jgi:hypothetical protein
MPAKSTRASEVVNMHATPSEQVDRVIGHSVRSNCMLSCASETSQLAVCADARVVIYDSTTNTQV